MLAAAAILSGFVTRAVYLPAPAPASSQPLTSGRGGFGFSVKDVTRRAYFDHLELFRQV